MWQALSAAALIFIEQGRNGHRKALWLLADARLIMLLRKSLNELFKPFMVMEGWCSVIADDLSESDVAFYAAIVDAIDDVWLKARVADPVWLKQRLRNVQFALAATEAYRLIPLDTERGFVVATSAGSVLSASLAC